MTDDSRRFSDREFALVLRKAAELQADNPVTAVAEGIRLSEIKQIAVEAGIDPGVIERAIREVDASRHSDSDGTGSVHYTEWVDGEVPVEDLGRLRDVIRDAMGAKARGTVEQVLDSLEWKSETGAGPATQVTITPRDGQTRVEMYTELNNARAGVYALTMTPLWLVTLFGAIGLSEAGLLAGPLAALIGNLAGPLIGAVIGSRVWKRVFGKRQRDLRATFDRIRRATGELADSDRAAPQVEGALR